jgi:signal peptidase
MGRQMWYLILSLVLASYLLITTGLLSGGYIETYLIQPLIWLAISIITIYIAYSEGINILRFKRIRHWTLGNSPIHAGLIIGGFQLSLLIFTGFLFGFGNSPYSFTPTTILTNIFFISTLLIGTEFSRAYLIKKGTRSRTYKTHIIILFALLYMLIHIAPEEFAVLISNQPIAILEFLGATLIAGLAISLLASYLSYLGGATAALCYTGLLLSFEWFSPILPNPPWIITALIGTIAPAIAYIILQGSIQPTTRKKTNRRTHHETKGHGWTTVAIFSILLIFFSYGFLGVTPTVIQSGSMQPELQIGDIVIIDEANKDTLQTGDIVQYVNQEKVLIVHRIYAINQSENGKVFITKGDANEHPDFDPVLPQNIRGKAIFTIPKLGWMQLGIRSLFTNLPIKMPMI